ncbi:MAG: hypothetical protein DRH26_15865 [Deltaproteobacteria bacterium]|nr:MAG: hypothetical protein DRH26_15865 [Deltaproteobacteria bacterium]
MLIFTLKEGKGKGENMPDNFLPLLIQGYYSDWVFNVLLTNLSLGVKNNLALLLLLAGIWVKISKYTTTKADDEASSWLMQRLTRMKEGAKDEKTKI